MTYTFNRPAFPATRMRRIRKNEHLRSMVRETHLAADHLIYPVFVLPGQNQTQDIPSMPNIQRLSADLLLKKSERLLELGVNKLALFPVTPQEDKSLTAEAAWREDGLVQNTLRLLKKELPEMVRFVRPLSKMVISILRSWPIQPNMHQVSMVRSVMQSVLPAI